MTGVTLTSERVEVPADPAAQYELSLAEHWGDGVPLLPATDDAIEALLAATPYPADHVVCVLPPRNGVATVELVAVNAAMAGVEPAAFAFVLAALEAISEPEWNAFGLTTTTSSVFPMLIVNGPCRDELGIDYRAGCMGGAAGRGSMTIGRAVALCLRNIGGQRAGETTKTVFGQPARFGFCIGEWEERSPWPSLAERRGFSADQDVVTVHGGKGTFPMADIHNDDPRDLLYLIAKSIAFPLANMFLGNVENGEVVVAINPMWAERFGAAFPDVDDLHRVPAATTRGSRSTCGPTRNAKILRDQGRVDAAGRVHLVERPDQIVPIVCGGLGSLHAIALPSFGESHDAEQAGAAPDVDVMMDPAVGGRSGRRARRVPARRRRRPAACARRTRRRRASISRSCSTTCQAARSACSRPTSCATRSTTRCSAGSPASSSSCSTIRADRSESARDDEPRRRRSARRAGARSSACTSRCCTTSCAALESEAGIDSGVFSALAYLERAPAAAPAADGRAARADAPALQPARLQPARAAHGGRRARRAPPRSRPTAGPRSS